MTSFRSSPTHPLAFLALWRHEPLDLDLELPVFLIKADVALIRVVAFWAVLEARRRTVARVLRLEFEARNQHLLHEQARRDRLQLIIHGTCDGIVGGVRLGDQVRESARAFCQARRGSPGR